MSTTMRITEEKHLNRGKNGNRQPDFRAVSLRFLRFFRVERRIPAKTATANHRTFSALIPSLYLSVPFVFSLVTVP